MSFYPPLKSILIIKNKDMSLNLMAVTQERGNEI